MSKTIPGKELRGSIEMISEMWMDPPDAETVSKETAVRMHTDIHRLVGIVEALMLALELQPKPQPQIDE